MMDAQVLAELNNIRIRIDEICNQSFVQDIIKPSDDYTRLLAVARAAKGAVYRMQMCGDESDAQRNLLEALAAVEDLL
jgi:predicted methyltransferase